MRVQEHLEDGVADALDHAEQGLALVRHHMRRKDYGAAEGHIRATIGNLHGAYPFLGALLLGGQGSSMLGLEEIRRPEGDVCPACGSVDIDSPLTRSVVHE